MKKEIVVGVVSALITAAILYFSGVIAGAISKEWKQQILADIKKDKPFQQEVAKQVQPPTAPSPDLESLKETLIGDASFQESLSSLIQIPSSGSNQFVAYPTWESGTNETERDNGLVESRNLDFTKLRNNTAIRIGYTDNLRVMGSGNACQWEILIDGESCPSGKLLYGYYAHTTSDNTHRSRHVVGYCEGLRSGNHSLQVQVSNDGLARFEGGDCYTGWKGSRWTLEVQEVPIL